MAFQPGQKVRCNLAARLRQGFGGLGNVLTREIH